MCELCDLKARNDMLLAKLRAGQARAEVGMLELEAAIVGGDGVKEKEVIDYLLLLAEENLSLYVSGLRLREEIKVAVKRNPRPHT